MKHRAPRPELPPTPPDQPDLYYLKLEPGAPLPPDLAADAQRYRLVDGQDYRDRKGIVAGVAMAMALGGIALTWTGVPGWLPGTIFSGAIIVAVLGGAAASAASAPRYVPADRGEYVLAPRSVVAERLGALAAPKLSMPIRVLCGAMGAFFVWLMMSLFVESLRNGTRPVDIPTFLALLAVVGVGVGFGWLALKGEVPFIRPVEVPASPWFHDLANPSVPLPDDAPISGPRSSGEPPEGPGTERRS